MPRERRYHWWRKVFLSLVLSVVSLEVVARFVIARLGLNRLEASSVLEAIPTAARFTFDPASGYRLSPEPFRWIVRRPCSGGVQSFGIVRGNNLGFRDSSDFQPARSHPTLRRMAVMGDSMTAGVYLPVDWPQRVEELSARRGRPIEVLNFAVDGGGVMNWWSIINNIVAKENYQLDDCLFALCCDDLSRGFFIRHDDFDGAAHHPWFGRVKGVRKIDLPTTLQEARHHSFVLGDDPGWSPSDVDQLLAAGQPNIEFTIQSKLVQLLLLGAVIHHFQPQGLDPGTSVPSQEMLNRFREMHDQLEQRSVRIWVVEIPMPSSDPNHQSIISMGIDEGTRRFADVMKTAPIAGGSAFEGLSNEEIRQHFLEGDPHWNQQGADRFADFIETKLARPIE